MPRGMSAPVWPSPMRLLQQPELITASTQNGSSNPPLPLPAAQDGKLITCLNKSQFKSPRGLALCPDEPPEHAYWLQGCSWQLNTREWLIMERTALLAGTARQNRSTGNRLCSFILARPWVSGKSLKLSWVGMEEGCAQCSPAMQTEIKRSQTPSPSNLRTTTCLCIHRLIEQIFILFLDSVRHCGPELGGWQCTCPLGTYILGCKDLLLTKNSLERRENSTEWNSHCPSSRHYLIKQSFNIYQWQLYAGFPHKHSNYNKVKPDTS